MNRNTENHFAELPQVDVQRSIFDRSFTHKTSFNVGELIPFYLDEVLPGDTFNVTTSAVVRLQTLLTPIMDNVYMDTYFFFVPNRLVSDHWKEIMGESSDSAWLPKTEYAIPEVAYPENGWIVGTIADYMGIPVGVYSDNPKDRPMAFPFRAYALVCNEWFRDQNVSDPLNIPTGDANQTGSNGDNYITDVVNGGKPFKVAKYHDYFTSALPSPQRGESVNLPIGGVQLSSGTSGFKVGVGSQHDFAGDPAYTPNLRFKDSAGNDSWVGSSVATMSNNNMHVLGIASDSTTDSTAKRSWPTNLWTEPITLAGSVGATSINDLRLAFQMQKFYEKLARGGSRYREIIREMFGTTSPDARMMIPEYLGGHRFPLAIHQVTNTSQGAQDFLGDLGAMSNTADVHDDFLKSFTEHGFIIGVCCVRYDHSYPQGLNKMWSRRSRLDYYWPVFANIGEQPVLTREIYLANQNGDISTNEDVFGYQEAWAEYRYFPDRVSGEMRPGIQNSLASWHLSDYYTEAPTLSDGWIREDKTNVDRVLAVTSEVSNQVFCDFYVKNITTRCMPMYSIPGLIDHH